MLVGFDDASLGTLRLPVVPTYEHDTLSTPRLRPPLRVAPGFPPLDSAPRVRVNGVEYRVSRSSNGELSVQNLATRTTNRFSHACLLHALRLYCEADGHLELRSFPEGDLIARHLLRPEDGTGSRAIAGGRRFRSSSGTAWFDDPALTGDLGELYQRPSLDAEVDPTSPCRTYACSFVPTPFNAPPPPLHTISVSPPPAHSGRVVYTSDTLAVVKGPAGAPVSLPEGDWTATTSRAGKTYHARFHVDGKTQRSTPKYQSTSTAPRRIRIVDGQGHPVPGVGLSCEPLDGSARSRHGFVGDLAGWIEVPADAQGRWSCAMEGGTDHQRVATQDEQLVVRVRDRPVELFGGNVDQQLERSWTLAGRPWKADEVIIVGRGAALIRRDGRVWDVVFKAPDVAFEGQLPMTPSPPGATSP